MKKPLSQKALEDFLNDDTEKTGISLYLWRGKTYQCMSATAGKTKGLRFDHFVKWEYNNKMYILREVSENLLRKVNRLAIDK